MFDITDVKLWLITLKSENDNVKIAGETFVGYSIGDDAYHILYNDGYVANWYVNGMDIESKEDYVNVVETVVEKIVTKTISLREMIGQDIKEIKL